MLAYVEKTSRLQPMGVIDNGAYNFPDASDSGLAPFSPAPMVWRKVARERLHRPGRTAAIYITGPGENLRDLTKFMGGILNNNAYM